MSDQIYGTVPGSTYNQLQREWQIQKNRADAAETSLAAAAEDRDRFYRISVLTLDANGMSLDMLKSKIAEADAVESPLLTAAAALEAHADALAAIYKRGFDVAEGNLHYMGGDAVRAGFDAAHFWESAQWLRQQIVCRS